MSSPKVTSFEQVIAVLNWYEDLEMAEYCESILRRRHPERKIKRMLPDLIPYATELIIEHRGFPDAFPEGTL